MRIQLWSYNFPPEPSGIAPLSGVWAAAMRERGHDVLVVAAHAHYPEAIWGRPVRPRRERHNGVGVVRLPLWIGRETGAQRIRQELSFAAALGAAAPLLPTPDVIVAVTPSFPGLLPAMVSARLRRIPWVMWLQDILPDGAATTGLVEPGLVLTAARRFERAAYASASRVVVISEAFEHNLRSKGVPGEKLVPIFNPSAVDPPPYAPPRPSGGRRRLLVMGNIGHSQGLAELVRIIERDQVLEPVDAELRIAGSGVAVEEVAAEIRSDRVSMVGLLLGEAMEEELAHTELGLVTQRGDVTEFNLPSKLMNYMAHGVPVLAVVPRASQTARIVRDSGAGWVVDSRALAEELGPVLAEIFARPEELARRGRRGHETAMREFAPSQVAVKHERMLIEAVGEAGRRASIAPE